MYMDSAAFGMKPYSVSSRWFPSDLDLQSRRVPTPSVFSRSCSTTPQPQSSSSPAVSVSPRWLPQSAKDALKRLQSIGNTASHNTPESVKQLASAAQEGNLFRVARIQSNNLWLRFGGAIVAVAFAGGTYTLYRTSQNVYSAVTGITENGWTFRILVRTSYLLGLFVSIGAIFIVRSLGLLLTPQSSKRSCQRSNRSSTV